MSLRFNGWKSLFLFCLGVTIAAAFCMKWMEDDLRAGADKFTILGLEFYYSKSEVQLLFSKLDERVKTILQYHLYFDFVFMAGIFPGIAALCMIAKKKVRLIPLQKLLMALAILQALAWAGDVIENCFLLGWIDDPVIGEEFNTYHWIVILKWVIALTAVLTALSFLLISKKQKAL